MCRRSNHKDNPAWGKISFVYIILKEFFKTLIKEPWWRIDAYISFWCRKRGSFVAKVRAGWTWRGTRFMISLRPFELISWPTLQTFFAPIFRSGFLSVVNFFDCLLLCWFGNCVRIQYNFFQLAIFFSNPFQFFLAIIAKKWRPLQVYVKWKQKLEETQSLPPLFSIFVHLQNFVAYNGGRSQ